MTDAQEPIYDLAIVGAGLQGASVAMEAVNRGLRTALIHAGPIGGSASARQSVLVGAGYEQLTRFNLDAFLCNSRELSLLKQRAGHLISPLPAYFFQNGGLRAQLKVTLGTQLYRGLWREGSAELAERAGELSKSAVDDSPFADSFTTAPAYQKPLPTFVLNYARLGIASLQALDDTPCDLLLHHRLVHAERHETDWQLEITDLHSNQTTSRRAKLVVNCAGTNVEEMIEDTFDVKTRAASRSAHVGQVFLRHPSSWRAAAIIDHSDSLLSLHPVGTNHLCLGTLNVLNADGDSETAKRDAVDRALAAVSLYTAHAFSERDIAYCQWSEQALIEDPVTGRPSEDLLLDLNNPGQAAPLLNVFGSKPCQHRKIAQQVLDVLADFYPPNIRRHSKTSILPGGERGENTHAERMSDLSLRYPFLDYATIERLLGQFGSRCQIVLQGVESLSDMGVHFGYGLYEREVKYLLESEWAKSAEDILWRRTLLGLQFDAKSTDDLVHYLSE